MPLSPLSASMVPSINLADWKKRNAATDEAELKLKKDKKDADAKKTLKSYAEETEKLEGQLGKVVDALEEKLGEIDSALDDIAKLKPMPDAILKSLEKQRRILTSSRAPEIKDLRKEQKRESLRSNPSKLNRLIGDLNDDVSAVNTLAGDVDKATDAMFAEEIASMRKAIVAGLEGPITSASLGLDSRIKAFTATNQKKRWKGFDAARTTFMASCATDAAEALRRMQVNALHRDKDFAALDIKKRNKIIDAAEKAGDSVVQVRADLQAALTTQTQLATAAAAAAIEAQWTLRKKAWGEHLGMNGYGIVQKGMHDDCKIHITYDDNSWTTAAYKGVSVTLGDGSVDKIFKALFEVDWTYQFHATLELPNKSGGNPHIYAFGEVHDKRWNEVANDNGKDKQWIKDAKEAVQDVLDAYIKDLKKKIKAVVDSAPKK